MPEGWSTNALDLVNRLLQRKPEQRIGYNGIEEIISHPWFKNINWQKLEKKEIQAPYLPNVMDISEFRQKTRTTILDNYSLRTLMMRTMNRTFFY